MAKRTLTFVSGNVKKLEEIKAILGSTFPFEIVCRRVDIIETQTDIDEIAVRKCQKAAELLERPVITEDTSLCFNALKGLPGPYIKWFLEKLKPEGLVRLLAGWEDKSAEAVCTIAYCAAKQDNLEIVLFQGRTKGTIVAPRGTEDFGWDCIFQPDNYDVTFAEMSREEKNKMSHRYIALQKLSNFIINL